MNAVTTDEKKPPELVAEIAQDCAIDKVISQAWRV